jgi:hypothetical protein
MPSSVPWRLNLILFLVFCGIAACGALVWLRRAAWHVVATMPGTLPYRDGGVPYVLNPDRAILTLLDSGEVLELPAEYRGRIAIAQFPSRAAFQFTLEDPDNSGPEAHCWNVAACREVSLPKYARRDWRFSASGARILVKDAPYEKPPRFEIIGLDGAVLRERILPVTERSAKDHEFSPEGRFVVATCRDDSKGDKTRIYDLESDRCWFFEDGFGAISDEGLVWLKDTRAWPNAPPAVRAVDLNSGRELWSIPVPEAADQVRYLGKDRLAIKTWSGTSLVDARSGRHLLLLEAPAEDHGAFHSLELREAGPKTFLVGGWTAWSADTGKLLPLKGQTPGITFFDDGRRVLVDTKCGSPARVLDVETGNELWSFAPPPRAIVGPAARLVGDRIFTMDYDLSGTSIPPIEVWERRYPEGWHGHLRRPELLGAIFLVAAFLVLWANRHHARVIPR